MHIPIGLALLIYIACIAPGLYRKWKADRQVRRMFAPGAGLTTRPRIDRKHQG